MRLSDTKNQFQIILKGLYDKEEIDHFFFMLVESYLGIKRIELALHPGLSFSKEELKPISEALNRLEKQEPIQYILGETEFFGLPFKVNPHVLIPRPETEELVAWIISQQSKKNKQPIHILDIGTGSGCIAVSLAKNLPNANVYALDVSKEALQTAKRNAVLNDVEVTFIEADILNIGNKDITPPLPKFDIIVSNPPYVRAQEKERMNPNVLSHEPHLALFVDDEDPLKFYKAIVQYAVDNLLPHGCLYFEINEYLGASMKKLLNTFSFNDIELRKDIFEKNRMIKGTKINGYRTADTTA